MSVSKLKIVEFTSPYKRPLGINAQQIVAKRYSLKDLQGNALETWDDIVKRVVSHVAKAEQDFIKREEFIANMMRLMEARAFIPNTPCLVNAGKPKGQLAACFVLPVPDSIEGIMEHAKYCALIHQSGGGTGMTYELLLSKASNHEACPKSSGFAATFRADLFDPLHFSALSEREYRPLDTELSNDFCT